MVTDYGHFTYCTNIHGGEKWEDHFELLRQHFPQVKQAVSPHHPMGVGLRLSDMASKALLDKGKLNELKNWLADEAGYVFTMNGFPFGDFHEDVVKAHVHTPDWTTPERLAYTKRLFDILAQLLPEGMDGGVSTSPLAYRHWYNETDSKWQAMRERATQQIAEVALHLTRIHHEQHKVLHLDIEPEPDGVLETGEEFIGWYTKELVPVGVKLLVGTLGITATEAEAAIKRHIRLCYDVCHFALGYENHQAVVDALSQQGIQIGKFQISAALKATLPRDSTGRQAIGEAFMAFNEPTYLHQVIAKQADGQVRRFKDLPDAQAAILDERATEWRSHFHIPIFLEDLGMLQSTQSDIIEVLAIQRNKSLTGHLEVETYTWGVLPQQLQLPIAESISRELRWVVNQMGE
ncbi:metabolite traffic protein EboE [Parapedobacter sp. 10938]|uniref:metabolite traffic protein EboE n=1 Tax=Parapedobacter flavus TaxID=3110225 RepID=UPI002DB77FBE|nr:metabolite traffic protein EboE [Parapedobacter sp. 10938]MEC3880478.1 metabolite traffic protein EboE [Parapedobacter sp. 10938]